jgi:predicted RNA-binding Zn ribbon-like protein
MIHGVGGDGPQPARRVPAPGRLRLVQDFVNTADLEGGVDRFGTQDGLRTWLLDRGLIDAQAQLGPEDLQRALRTRDAIRALAIANNGDQLDPTAAESLNEVLARAPLQIEFDDGGGAALAPTTAGISGALSRILAAIYESMIEGTWPRLKACRRDVCHWVFYDHSRNRSSTWCAMSICGNRVKTKAYYRRKASR